MVEIVCPACSYDEPVGGTGPAEAGAIALHCPQCGHDWARTPKPSCPRCGSGEVDETGYEGWSFDDPDEARENPATKDWAYVDRSQFRCRKCRHQWQTSGASRP